MRLILLSVLALGLSGCLARTAVDIVTLPVKVVSAGVDAATTSQSEADQRRGRQIREEEERLGRLARRCHRRPERAECAELFEGLAAIVDSIDRLYPIVPAIEWLAVQSARRGLGEHHYFPVVEAMLSAFRDGLGDDFTVELELAWREAARQVSAIMAGALEAEPLAA